MRSERVPAPLGVFSASAGVRHASTYGGIRGDVFMDLMGSDGSVIEHREIRNLICKDASILLARLMKDNLEANSQGQPTLHGAWVLAVGTGNFTDIQHPPAATNTQRSLFSEIARKRFSSTRFVDASGAPSDRPTNVVDFSTTFAEAEAVGALVEMALLGGNIADTNMSLRNPVMPPNGPYDPTVDLRLYETEINYTTFPVWNKPATSSLAITWRLTF